MAGLTDRHRTDDGMHFTRLAVVAEVHLTRRDDMRGVWEVEGEFYATRAEAMEAAERALDKATAGFEWLSDNPHPEPEGETTAAAPSPPGYAVS